MADDKRIDVTDPEVMAVDLVPLETEGMSAAWVHTHGLAKLGFPELEIRFIHPVYLMQGAAAILNQLADSMVNSDQPWKLGEHVSFGDGFVVQLVEAETPMDEEHTGYWTFDPVSLPACRHCGGSCEEPH